MALTTLDSVRDIKVYQSKDGYRFSVDALLLYSFVDLKFVKKIIDIGSGSGIVGLLLAKRYARSEVALLELQKGLYELSLKNIALNGLEDRVKALRADMRKLPDGISGFDLAVSNPPFRKPFSGLLNDGVEKSIARHEIEMKLPDLLKAASGALKEKGRLCLIYHPLRLAELMNELKRFKLEPKRLRLIHGNADAEAKMALVEAVKNGRGGLKVEKPLFVYGKDGKYSEEMEGIYATGD